MIARPSPQFQPNHMQPPMPPPPYPSATASAFSGYGGIQQQLPMRHNSMISTSSQNTFAYRPQTPTTSTPIGINSADQSPFNEWSRPDAMNSNAASNQMANGWDFDNNVHMNHAYDSALFNDTPTNNLGESFVHDFFG